MQSENQRKKQIGEIFSKIWIFLLKKIVQEGTFSSLLLLLQKWSHFIFHPLQDLMKEKTNSFCFLLAFIHSSFVILSMELSKNIVLQYFLIHQVFRWILSQHGCLRSTVLYFILVYFILSYICWNNSSSKIQGAI